MTYAPTIPDSAPFTAEQRSWLNGYLAGLFAWNPQGTLPGVQAPAATGPAEPLMILFGSQTGGAEKAAKMLAKAAKSKGYAVTVRDMAETKPADLVNAGRLCVIASTYGDGEPPDRAREFWKALSNGAPRLEQTSFSVLALGDASYAKFCAFGREIDLRLEELGANRLTERRECDGDWADVFKQWSTAVLSSAAPTTDAAALDDSDEEDTRAVAQAPMVTNRRLSGESSAKDVRHIEFDLASTCLTYHCGDACRVWAQNDPALVAQLLTTAGWTADTSILRADATFTLSDALTSQCDITRVSPALRTLALADMTPDEAIAWSEGRDVLDVLHHLISRGAELPTPQTLIAALRDLQPRLYSISSSPLAHGTRVHLTLSAVRYTAHGRPRQGVCSTFLSDRLPLLATTQVEIHENATFRLPSDDVPLIMIGPGTGVAPFRGFLHQRRAAGAIGRNWLFFGDQRQSTDFLYQDEINSFRADGTLTRCDLAWSRDGDDKVYVQHLMARHAADLWAWLQEGAAIYVCGDASRMAKDVDATLRTIIQTQGHLTEDAANAYLAQLQQSRRYVRDVY
jgi:sulfite reductase (NADPH) flavoprotein alpha-component